MVVQLVDFPLEILQRISECLCPHCFEGPDDAYHRFRGLFNLILTCKVFGSVAQPALYHCPFHTETWLSELRPGYPPKDRTDQGPNIAKLVRTVIEVPALAAAVRELNFCPTFPQHRHDLSEEEIAYFEREMDLVLDAGEEDVEEDEDDEDDEEDDDEDDEGEEEENENGGKNGAKTGPAEEDEEDEADEEDEDDEDDENEEDNNETDEEQEDGERTIIKCDWEKKGAVFSPEAEYSCDSNEYLRMLLVAKTSNLEILAQFEPSSFDRPDFELPHLRDLFLWNWQGQLGWGMEYINKILEGAPALRTINCTGIYGAKLKEGHIYHETVTDLCLLNAMLSPEHLCNVMRGFPNLERIKYVPGDNVPSGYEAPPTKDIADALWIRSDTLLAIEVDMTNYDSFSNLKNKPIEELEGMEALRSLVWTLPLFKHVWLDGEWEFYGRRPVESDEGDEDGDEEEEEEEGQLLLHE